MSAAQDDYYLDTLRKVQVFRYLSDDALKEILKISDVINYKTDDKIISEGEHSQYFYAVLKGNVNVCVKQDDGKQVYLSTLEAGDVFGEAGMFMRVKRTADVVSVDNSALLRLDRKSLFDFLNRRPKSGVKMLLIIIYSLLKRLRDSSQELAFERKTNLAQKEIDQLIDDFGKD
jgi:CRP-like cAMP-binding protein